MAQRWEADVILNDGSIATLRAIELGDRVGVEKFFRRVSEHSKYLRFFSTHPTLTEEDWRRWADIRGHDKVTLVMLQRGEVIAVAGYELVESLLPARVGDVSFLVQDSHHGQGAANILLEHLAEIGREGGVERFVAEMLTQNRQMVQVFRRAGYTVRPELADGFISVDFAIAPSAASCEVMQRRELRAEASSIRELLAAGRVAVVGSPAVPSLVDAPRFPSPAELKGQFDLVVAEYAGDNHDALMRAAAAAGAAGVVLMSRGTNPGLSGAASRAVVAAARANGVRALGPASLGLINTATGLNATPASTPRAGATGLFAQSAGVAALALSHAIERGCGLSSFVASGALADVTGNDVMQFWSTDDATRICLLSLDSVGNPRKFFRILRRAALEKHVVVFLPSRALAAANPAALDGVIRDAGAMVVTRRDAMYDIAQLLARQPAPAGARVRVLSNSAGLTAQMAAAARRFGLEPSAATVQGDPGSGLPREAAAALADPAVDAVLCAAVDIGAGFAADVHAQLAALAAREALQHATPLIASFVGFGLPDYRVGEGPEGLGQLPVVDTYADALEALAAVLDNARRRESARPRPEDEEEPSPGADAEATHAIVSAVLADAPRGRQATDDECARLLAAYGIDVLPWSPAPTLADALAAAESLGWDVVLKCLSPRVRGRGELPTVIRHISSPAEMERAWSTLAGLARDVGCGADPAALAPAVQRTVASGATLTLGAVEDPALGPMVSVGVTGPASELLGDVSWGVPPLRPRDARRMLGTLQAAPLLTGYRGAAPADTDGLARILVRLARLKDDLPTVAEVELTPVISSPTATVVAGARLRIAAHDGQRDPLARSLAR